MSNFVNDRDASQKVYGLVIGIVTANNDDIGYTVQVKLRYPTLEGGSTDSKQQFSSDLVRVASFSAGHHVGDDPSPGPRGALFLPEIGDEVVCAFEEGDIHRPIILGRLWSNVSADKKPTGDEPFNAPIYSHGNTKGRLAGPADGPTNSSPNTKTKHEKGKNDLSGIVTRSGHVLTFNDNKSEPAVYLWSSKQHRIEMIDADSDKRGILLCDPDGNYVWLKSGTGVKGDIEIKTTGNIKMTAEKDITLTSTKGSIKLDSNAKDVTVHANSKLSLVGDGGMRLHTDSSGEVSAGKGLTVSGHPINLN